MLNYMYINIYILYENGHEKPVTNRYRVKIISTRFVLITVKRNGCRVVT